MDRFSEKYVDTSPYHYTKNNPIFFVDYKGDSLTLTAEKRDILDKIQATINKGLGGEYVTIGENGLVH